MSDQTFVYQASVREGYEVPFTLGIAASLEVAQEMCAAHARWIAEAQLSSNCDEYAVTTGELAPWVDPCHPLCHATGWYSSTVWSPEVAGLHRRDEDQHRDYKVQAFELGLADSEEW